MISALVADEYNEIFAALFLINLFLLLQLHFRPYSLRKHNMLESMALGALALTQAISMVYLRTEHNASLGNVDETQRLTQDVVTTVALTIPNLVAVVVLAMAIFKLGPFKTEAADTHRQRMQLEAKMMLLNGGASSKQASLLGLQDTASKSGKRRESILVQDACQSLDIHGLTEALHEDNVVGTTNPMAQARSARHNK
jgi:hypothetical protein